jgi:hypothetical protein
MKKATLMLIALLTIVACGEKQADLTVTGNIKGLKKGTVYLQAIRDTTLVMLDSVAINGEEPFILQSELEEPEVLYLTLDKNSKEDERIVFFADKGVTQVNTSLKSYAFKPEIIGSKQQEKLAEYRKMMSRFNDRNLELIKEQFEARQSDDSSQILAKANEASSLLKRKYLYAINFALNNKDSQIAPYIALAEVFDANTKYLDTIYNALPENIANSRYGVQLNKFIKERKTEEDSVQ